MAGLLGEFGPVKVSPHLMPLHVLICIHRKESYTEFMVFSQDCSTRIFYFFLEEIAYSFSLEIKDPIQEGAILKVWKLARSMAFLARV